MKPQYSDTTLYTTTGLEVRWARVVIQRGLLSFLFKQKFNFSMRNTVAVPCIASAVNDETVRVTAESFIVWRRHNFSLLFGLRNLYTNFSREWLNQLTNEPTNQPTNQPARYYLSWVGRADFLEGDNVVVGTWAFEGSKGKWELPRTVHQLTSPGSVSSWSRHARSFVRQDVAEVHGTMSSFENCVLFQLVSDHSVLMKSVVSLPC
jgi:hypothetical protein